MTDLFFPQSVLFRPPRLAFSTLPKHSVSKGKCTPSRTNGPISTHVPGGGGVHSEASAVGILHPAQLWIANLSGAHCALRAAMRCDVKTHHANPKDPAVLKILRHSKLTVRSNFTSAQWFTMATPLALTQFSWVLQAFFPSKSGSRCSEQGGVVKTLRRSNSLSRSIFSTAGSFGKSRDSRVILLLVTRQLVRICFVFFFSSLG